MRKTQAVVFGVVLAFLAVMAVSFMTIPVQANQEKSVGQRPVEVVPGRLTITQSHIPQHDKVESDNGRAYVRYSAVTGQAELVAADGKVVLANKGRFGQVDANGNAYLGDWATGLFRYDANTGAVAQLAPPEKVGVPFYVDSSGHYLVYQTFYTPGSSATEGLTNAAPVLLDLTTGEGRILYQAPNQYVHALAWVGNRVLIQSWEDGPVDYNVFKLVDAQGRTERLSGLQQAPLAIGWPVASPNQRFLVYPAKEGVVLIDPLSQRFKVYQGVDHAYWSRNGLVLVNLDGSERVEHPNLGG